MQQTPLTAREQTSHGENPKSSLAVVSVFFIILLFGFFWFWQQREIENITSLPPISETTLSGTSHEKEDLDYSSLEASAVNISIPSFEQAL